MSGHTWSAHVVGYTGPVGYTAAPPPEDDLVIAAEQTLNEIRRGKLMSGRPEVLIVNSIGPDGQPSAFTGDTLRYTNLGGSELEITQLAEALAEKDHSVVVANGVEQVTESRWVRYVPLKDAISFWPTKALIAYRTSDVRPLIAAAGMWPRRVIVRANDLFGPAYMVHSQLFERGAVLVANSQWQADLFAPLVNDPGKRRVIPPIIDDVRLQYSYAPRRFIHPCGPSKGREPTIALWRDMKRRYPKEMEHLQLMLMSPGWGGAPVAPADAAELNIHVLDTTLTAADYRAQIAKCEGLFAVSEGLPEVFGCYAAIAEQAGVRAHILCRSGLGGLPEALSDHKYLTTDQAQFERDFLAARAAAPAREQKPNRFAAEKLIPRWCDVLGLSSRAGTHVEMYPSRSGQLARRYWVHDRVLVGGNITSPADAAHLKDDLGVTHVLSFESEYDEDHWPRTEPSTAARFPFADNGTSIDDRADLVAAATFAARVLVDPNNVLYCHCQLGGSRGPTAGYLALRLLDHSPEEAMAAIRETRGPDWHPHAAYIESIEKMLARAVRNTTQQELPALLGGNSGILQVLRTCLDDGGSEYGALLQLFALTASIRASTVVEIGRFKGASTLALAAALQLVDASWQEPERARQRPDVDYGKHESPRPRAVFSIDPNPRQEAVDRIRAAGLERYVKFVDRPSDQTDIHTAGIDVLLVDGGWDEEQIKRDVAHFVPLLRPGGYFILRNHYGWCSATTTPVCDSPFRRVADALAKTFERLVIDTGYAGLAIFRKPAVETKPPSIIKARGDKRPTVGAALLAKNESPIIARAIRSVQRLGVDAVTVVVDETSSDDTADLAKALGAEVFVRPWRGNFAAARNELIAIAEQRTDYLLMCDADDAVEGKLPANLGSVECHRTIVRDGPFTAYQRVHLFQSKRGFRYTGCERNCDWEVKHEFLYRSKATEEFCTDLVYRRIGATKGVSGYQDSLGTRNKYLGHARAILVHHAMHPECTRTVCYLGQSYRDASEGKDLDLIREARDWYRKRAKMTHGDEEQWLALCEIAKLSAVLKDTGVPECWLEAHAARPARMEPLMELAAYYNSDAHKEYELAYLFAKRASELPVQLDDERLFRDVRVPLRVRYELAVAAKNSGRKGEAKELLQALLSENAGPQEELRQMLADCT